MVRFVVAFVLAGFLGGCMTHPTVVTPGLPRLDSPGTVFWWGWQTVVFPPAPAPACEPRKSHRRHAGHHHDCTPPVIVTP
jgi:hypothetical protein